MGNKAPRSTEDHSSVRFEIYTCKEELNNGVTAATRGRTNGNEKERILDNILPSVKHKAALYIFCLVSCVMCFVVIRGCLMEPRIGPNNANVLVPCESLSSVYPIIATDNTNMNQLHEEIVNERLKQEGIRRVKDESNGAISCEVSPVTMMAKMDEKRYDAVDARVTLKAASNKLTYHSAAYTLLVAKTEISPRSDISVDHEAIVIQQGGNYFIYFGTDLFYDKDSRCKSLAYKTFIAKVLVQERSVHLPRPMFSSEHTCCLSCDTETKSSFSGGLFRLRKRDRIYVNVSSSAVLKKSGNHFLGVFRVKGE